MTKSEFIQNAAIQYAMKGVDPAAAWQKASDLAGAAPQNVAWEAKVARQASPTPGGGSTNGPVFPPFGKAAGRPVVGARENDLRFYAGASRRTLTDPAKARWHEKERELLHAYVAEMKRQGFDASEFDTSEEPEEPPESVPSAVSGDDDLPPF